jgi:predicted O-linked N-acetylglucosamine transferase (SPINDLY family)
MTDPPPLAQEASVEQLVYLPRVFSVYQPPAGLPDVGPPPLLRSGHITFGSFNSLPKLNDGLLRTWCEILRQVPDSRILLKNVAFGFGEPRQQVLGVFARHGIRPERVEFMGGNPGKREHLQSLGRVDITLDSFPYNGTTTTCDSLIMGVPVVTRAGTEHRSRVGVSLLSALQLESLVARDDNEYIGIASRLARDREFFLSTRSGLRERFQASPLMDAGALTRGLESKLEQIRASWCQQE